MTLYLHEEMLEEIEVDGQKTLKGVEEVRKASKAGIKGQPPSTLSHWAHDITHKLKLIIRSHRSSES